MSITAHTDPNDHDNRSAGSSQSTAFQRFQQSLSFELDPFQIEGCQALEEGRGVLVCAPTGAGKTIVGEFAVALAKEQGVRCIYTTPIKALSNQKFHDLQAYGEVGLLTGDVSINPDADIVVMTTEVLRNMLYAGSPTLERLGFVVMDEIHYLADPSRGAVWEEVILNLPDTVQIIGLSATVSNSEEFGDWLRTVRGDTRVVVTDNRPVPLDQWMMAGQKIYPMFSKGEPNPLLRSLHGSSRVNRPAMIRVLGEMGMLPAIDFIFSRAGCDDALFDCLRSKISLTSKEEAAQIATIIDVGIEDIDTADLKVLNFPRLRQALMRGFAAHHAGMLPAFKHIVEKLFVRGLVKVVFATETLALGINMPARTVVIEKLTKFNGDSHVELTPAQYTQLTGRAGRRGIDTIGNAVVMWHPRQHPTSVAGLASTRTYPLESTFTPGYNMSVNLINTIGYVHARGLIEQSFAQRTVLFTPGASSSPFSLVNTFASMMIPYAPCGTLREVSRTSLAFSPKIARNRRSSAVSSVSPFGVTLPTRISPARTSAPMRMIPRSSRSFSASSPTPGTSLVISSGPSLVSRASASYSSIWTEVYTSS